MKPLTSTESSTMRGAYRRVISGIARVRASVRACATISIRAVYDAQDACSVGGFACCIAIKKESAAKASPIAEGADPATATISSGGWNSIHVVEARVSDGDGKCRYKLTTTGLRLHVLI